MGLFRKIDFDGLLSVLEQLVEELVKKNGLPERGVIVAPNYGTGKDNEGQLISYSITSNEPDYPASEDDLLDKNRHHTSFLTLKALSGKMEGLVEMQVGYSLLRMFPPPPDAVQVLQRSGESYDDRFRISLDSSNLVGWVRDIVQYRISTYVTAASPFGCCDLFQKCSDARKCIHPNRMYSTACSYRSNLEAGRIFYGKNRNV